MRVLLIVAFLFRQKHAFARLEVAAGAGGFDAGIGIAVDQRQPAAAPAMLLEGDHAPAVVMTARSGYDLGTGRLSVGVEPERTVARDLIEPADYILKTLECPGSVPSSRTSAVAHEAGAVPIPQ
jgi:hypothetical protein